MSAQGKILDIIHRIIWPYALRKLKFGGFFVCFYENMSVGLSWTPIANKVKVFLVFSTCSSGWLLSRLVSC